MTNNADMKKYIQPQTQVVEISVRQFIADSIGVYGSTNNFNPNSEKIEVSESDGDDDW